MNRKDVSSGGSSPVVKVAGLLLLLLVIAVSAVSAQEGELQFVDPPQTEEIAAPEDTSATTTTVLVPIARDTFVASNSPSTNFGFDPFVRFGMVPSTLGAQRPMLYFDLTPFIPSNARITQAVLEINVANISPPGDTGRGYAAHSLAQSWSEGGVTWNSMPQWGPEIGRGQLASSLGWQGTNITGLAQEWLRNPGGNNGVILIGDERPEMNFERAYFSRQSGSGTAPRLRVDFDSSVDTTAPTARVTQPSPGVWSPPNFVVRWEGNDPNNPDGSAGSGIKWYDGWYSIDGGNTWTIGRAQTPNTETNVTGATHLQRYDFYVRAVDNADNAGPTPSGPGSSQSWTRVDGHPPAATVNPLPEYTAATSFNVSWQDTSEQGESGVAHYDVQFRANGGAWTVFVYNTQTTAATFSNAQSGVHYEFRARAVDNVGNEQPWPAGPQASTTIWLEPIAYVNPFSSPIYQQLDGPNPGDGFTVTWGAHIPPGTSIAAFDLRFRRDNFAWLSWLSNTQQTSSFFSLATNDPDGVYTFQARARDSNGIQGQYRDEYQATIAVDRNEPFIQPQIMMPMVIRN